MRLFLRTDIGHKSNKDLKTRYGTPFSHRILIPAELERPACSIVEEGSYVDDHAMD